MVINSDNEYRRLWSGFIYTLPREQIAIREAIINRMVSVNNLSDGFKIADPIDVAHTLSMIPSSTLKFVKFLPDYGHGDFVWGVTAASDIYNPAIAIIKSTINI